MANDWETTYTELNYIKDESHWRTHIFRKAELPQPADVLECSFLCKNVERQSGCDFFLMEVSLQITSTYLEITLYDKVSSGSNMLSWKIIIFWK